MVHKEKQKLHTRCLPIQRRNMYKVVVALVEEGLEDGEKVGDRIPDTDDFLNLILLPFAKVGFDVEPPIFDYSQLLTEFYEN